MNSRREPKKNRLEKAGARVRQRAMSGTEASTVGFVLVLYVFAGAGLGYLADTFFETNWIVAAGVLAGSALGFREMFRMIKKISRIEEKASEAPAPNQHQSASVPQFSTQEYSAPQPATPNLETEHEETETKRGFIVPPPPSASFDKPDSGKHESNPKLPR